MCDTLSIFHPLIRRWFEERVGLPTDVQNRAWPHIAAGRHVLIMAPTGSGKTLAAFLYALNQLLSGEWTTGRTRVLYVSPLKALNNDVQRNLLAPLAELRARFESSGEPWPEIRVATRSGDTDPRERQSMLRRPPEVLITTPESLNLILSSPRAHAILADVATVILDEIHAVAGSKRGTHLLTAVDRLVWPLGLDRDPHEFQRVALSATIRPLETIAEFVGGYELCRDGATPRYSKRRVSIVKSSQTKDYEVRVGLPETKPKRDRGSQPMLERLAREFKALIAHNRSTLLFTNNRRLCERITLLINEGEEEMLAYSHHGSLSRETRAVVEERLKRGELKAIVATSSLELGIDVGALDEVVLVQTPLSVSSAVQRVGRAGHQVGAASRGALYPTHGRDLLDAAIMARCLAAQDIEAVQPVACPLDVLAQVIVSITTLRAWDLDELFDLLRTSWPFHGLSRSHYDLVIKMLAGRYEESRLRTLRPLASVDAIDNTIAGKEAARLLLYSSGGTIPDRGDFHLRRADSNARIGDLDEEFVWEHSPGDTFVLGVQTWKIRAITHNDVLVDPSPPGRHDVPFWRAEDLDRDYHFSERIAAFLEFAETHLDNPQFLVASGLAPFLDPEATKDLARFLARQRAATGCALPHRRHIVVEHVADHTDKEGCTRVVLHTLWGGRVNRPFAFALAQAWEDQFHHRLEVFANNDCVVAAVPDLAGPVDFFELVHPNAIESLLRRRLEETGFFGARFRENAARALLLPRQGFNRRMPLWLNRLRSKKLLDAVSRYEDFPLLIETWRSCLQDEFDIPTLRRLLREVRSGTIARTETTTHTPSPFAEGALWRLTNLYMYQDDSRPGGAASRLRDDLVREAVFTAELRPRIGVDVVRGFEEKAQCLYPGYAPRTPTELLDWVKERLFIPEVEWESLVAASQRDSGTGRDALLETIDPKLMQVHFPAQGVTGVVALEGTSRFLHAVSCEPQAAQWSSLHGEPCAPPFVVEGDEPENGEADVLADWLAEWLRFYGPREKRTLAALLPVDPNRFEETIASLVETRSVVADQLTEPAGGNSPEHLEICDSENLEILLRLSRAKARPAFDPLPAEALPLFLATHQRVAPAGDIAARGDRSSIQRALEPLFGYPIPAALLETEILPGRQNPYAPSMLDVVAGESDLVWFGSEGRRVVLCLAYGRELFVEPAEPEDEREVMWRHVAPRLFADPRGQYYFNTLLDQTKLTAAELTESLWEFVWEGRITNDSFAALRKGIETGFKDVSPPTGDRRPNRRRFKTWRSSRTYPGVWSILPAPDHGGDLIDREELNKERVRVLLDRYGVVFRELLARELPPLRWAAVFRTLRLMELSGEVLTGFFFEGVSGLQFASHGAFETLRKLADEPPQCAKPVFWLNASDPASLCGVDVKGLKSSLPRRRPSTHLVYHGTDLVVVSQRNGKVLDIRVAPDDPDLPRYFGFMKNLLTRRFRSLGSVGIETINGARAVDSPYLTWLRDLFDISVDSKTATVWRPI